MNEQEDFFSPNHNRLLSIATWAKYLSRIVLIFYILLVTLQILQLIVPKDQGSFFEPTSSLTTMLRVDPLSALGEIVSISTIMLRGFVYYIVLKGISLGLNMIVEMDINYRERRNEEA